MAWVSNDTGPIGYIGIKRKITDPFVGLWPAIWYILYEPGERPGEDEIFS